MADVLNRSGRFWALDKLCLCYLAAIAAVIVVYWNQIPQAGVLLLLHVAGAAIIILAVKLPGRASWYVHHLYVLPFGGSCYREMAILIPGIRHSTADQWLADCDFAIWHANPTVWLERLQTPALTEFLQLIYALFLPVVLLMPLLLWRQQQYTDFYYCAFLLTLGFLVSYAGYMMAPARGPRFFLQDLQHEPLRGLWLFNALRGVLDRLESAAYDCFPSGHAELTILAWWSSRQVSKGLSRVYLAYTLCIIFATVYLRYHYTVDLFAGAFVALVLILTTPAMYRKLSGEDLIGSDIGSD